jgi:hypothetical protein
MTYTGPQPQYEWDLGIGANDGTRWVYVGDIVTDHQWVGHQPGEDGSWIESDETMHRYYPEVVAWRDTHTEETRP